MSNISRDIAKDVIDELIRVTNEDRTKWSYIKENIEFYAKLAESMGFNDNVKKFYLDMFQYDLFSTKVGDSLILLVETEDEEINMTEFRLVIQRVNSDNSFNFGECQFISEPQSKLVQLNNLVRSKVEPRKIGYIFDVLQSLKQM